MPGSAPCARAAPKRARERSWSARQTRSGNGYALPEGYDIPEGPPRLEMKLDETTSADVHLEAQVFPNGTTSNRLMVGLKKKF